MMSKNRRRSRKVTVAELEKIYRRRKWNKDMSFSEFVVHMENRGTVLIPASERGNK